MVPQQPFLGAGAGGGEELVQDFVSMQMTSILRPFAESVQQLQAEVDELLESTAQARDLVSSHVLRLDQHDERLQTLEASSTQTSDKLERTQADIGALKKEKRSLEGNHEMTKAAVVKSRETLGGVATSVEELQQALRDALARLGDVEAGLPREVGRLEDYVEGRLNKQGKATRDLTERHTALTTACTRAEALAEDASKSVSEIVRVGQQQRKQDLGSVTNLGDLASSLEARLFDVNKQLLRHDDSFKDTDRELQHLKNWTDSMADLRELGPRQAECGAAVKEAMRRLDRAEEGICLVRQEGRPEVDEQAKALARVDQRLTSSIADIVQWKQTATAQYDALSSTGDRLNGLEQGQARLEARTAAAELEIASAAAWRTDSTQTLQALGRGAEEQRAATRQAQELAAGTSAGLGALRGEVGTDREHVAKLSSRIDMCCSYFNGLGRGLQDTQRQILSGDGGLLPPPKASHAAALPALPRARTPRAGMPSPRRAVENGLR